MSLYYSNVSKGIVKVLFKNEVTNLLKLEPRYLCTEPISNKVRDIVGPCIYKNKCSDHNSVSERIRYGYLWGNSSGSCSYIGRGIKILGFVGLNKSLYRNIKLRHVLEIQ